MGRYAYFNTEFEYKFLFGVQRSIDITWFGGRRVLTMEWNAEEDLEGVMQELNGIAQFGNLTLPDFNSYTKDMDGLERLYGDLLNKYSINSPIHAKFCLGCLIYHQLTYTPNLSCRYEE